MDGQQHLMHETVNGRNLDNNINKMINKNGTTNIF